MRAFLCVFLRVKKSARAEGTIEEWKSLEKEVVRYEVDDSDNESENSDGKLEGEDEDGDNEVDHTPIDPDFDAVRNAADSQMIDECEDGEKCTGTHLNDDIELPPLSVEERKQARVLLAKAIGLSKTVQNSSLNSEAWETKSKELNVTLLTLVKYTFSGEEWTILEQLEDILKTFIAATEKISKAEVALVFEVIPLIDKFTTMFGHMIDDTTLHISICHAANTALTVLNKYYSFTDDSEIYRIAMILHPRYKTFYFQLLDGNNHGSMKLSDSYVIPGPHIISPHRLRNTLVNLL
ncbi:hypothetical protein DFH08DRAFT_956573 [Mycena albidolilacea]|uniref:Uncharacterized protein n=1 Tax=Mycena albidolilacea TaxID=1033008 RepID=A0AAD7AAI6_9AGAR|nr:hypothetical protein DFH08DRAFT_956573 [Mycena albidolilacea]